MSSVLDKIRLYGRSRDTEALEEYIKTVNTDQLIKAIEEAISNVNFMSIWDYLLEAFTDSPQSHDKRFKVVMSVLKALETSDISTTNCQLIVQKLGVKLSKFKVEHLVEICDFCLESIQKPGVSQMSWKDLLPTLLNLLADQESIDLDDSVLTGLEYKHRIINSMCLLKWLPEIVTPLASTFKEMPLSDEEHFQVVNKLGAYMEKMTPQEIPSFVYQLLCLCSTRNSRCIFLRLQNYFGARIYEIMPPQNDNNSDNTDMDLIESASNQEAIEAESTVLYHIHAAASTGHGSIQDYLSSLKHFLRSPEFILHPFQLSVLLTVSTIPHYEERVLEILRSCVSRTFTEEQKKIQSAWFREMVPSTCQVEPIFFQIINLSAEDRELVFKGLFNFAFLLLGVGTSFLAKDVIAEKQWHLGCVILIKIIKQKRHIAPFIIEHLSNLIVTGHTVAQYIECLYILSKNLALLMLENKSIIVDLMEGLVQMPANNANLLLDALIPLTKVSPTIRDHFILILRKALYSRVTETRQMAVNGFVKLVTHLKISNLTALSQRLSQSSQGGSFSSNRSLFTQIESRGSVGGASVFTNEALCLEILNILGRGFMQQAEVKMQLYEGFYEAVCTNPELGISILDEIWLNFQKYYNMDNDILPPLQFNLIYTTKDVNVILQEPLGKLIFTIGLILTKVTDSDNPTVIKFVTFMDSLCDRMTSCELVHFNLDDGTDLLDIVPESKEKLLILKEAMSVYEALIGYKMCAWESQNKDFGKEVHCLFQAYNRLVHFSKNLSKTKKKKIDQNVTTQQLTGSTSNVKKDGPRSTKAFKMPDTILNFQVICKTLSLLHESMVTWTTDPQANVLKTKREFHQYIMQATLNLITAQKNKKNIDGHSGRVIFNYFTDIAMIIYERIIKRLEEFVDFDCLTAILALECFHSILVIVNNQYGDRFLSILSKVGGKDVEEELVCHLTDFVSVYQKIFEIDEEEISDDPEIKKLTLLVVNTLSFLSTVIPVTSSALSIQLIDWLKDYITTNTFKTKPVATSFINLAFSVNIKFKISMNLFEQVSLNIGRVAGTNDDEEQNFEELKAINELSISNCVISLCNSLKSVMDDIEWIIARLRGEFAMITYPGAANAERKREYLKSKERGVSCQLCLVVSILTNLSNCTIPIGNLSEAILKNLSQLYTVLGSLTKYFISRSSKVNPVFQNARFERLVKLTGKQLTPSIYKLIMYIEENQKKISNSPKKKTPDSSILKSRVLKETRLIPKVILQIEQFSKYVIQLSNKTKIDLSKLAGQGTVRDFRIMGLKETLEKNIDKAPPVNQVPPDSDSSLIEQDEVSSSDEENSPPPTKKSKK